MGFVVCASCGTQIKAGRAYCLRCGEDLPVEGAPAKFSAWESLELPQHKLLILLGVVALIVVALVVVIWKTQPVGLDDVAQPVNVPAVPRPVPPPPAAENAAPSESTDPAAGAPRPVAFGALNRGAHRESVDSARNRSTAV
jgi:hypothetical protein